MVNRRIKDSSSDFDQASTYRVDEDLQREIKKRLRIRDSNTLELAVNDVETVIRAYRIHRLMPSISEERDRFGRIHRAANELLSNLGSLSFRSHSALVKHIGAQGDFTYREFLPLLEEMGRAVSLCGEQYGGNPKRERRGVEKYLVALLVRVFQTYYPPDRPRRGRNSTFRRDMVAFVVHCLEAAGVPNIPDEPTLYRRYIMPALRWLEARDAVGSRPNDIDVEVYPSS